MYTSIYPIFHIHHISSADLSTPTNCKGATTKEPYERDYILQKRPTIGRRDHRTAIRWLRLEGSLKPYVSFTKEPYKREYILQKRPIFWRSLLIIATPYLYVSIYTLIQITFTYNTYSKCHVYITDLSTPTNCKIRPLYRYSPWSTSSPIISGSISEYFSYCVCPESRRCAYSVCTE